MAQVKQMIGADVIELSEVTSTNDYTSAMLQQLRVAEGVVVRADYQTSGRGYSDNKWEGERGKNLLASIVLKPTFLLPSRQFFLNQIVSLAAAETVASFVLDDNVKIKWPNDIYYHDKKIGGILIENSIQGNIIQHSIVGIGFNVNQTKFSSATQPTSLKLILHEERDLKKVLRMLCENLEYYYQKLKKNQVEEIQKDYMKRLYRLEEESGFMANGKDFVAKIVGLTAEGKLMLQWNDNVEAFGFKEIEMMI